jgi:hypothetical protein
LIGAIDGSSGIRHYKVINRPNNRDTFSQLIKGLHEKLQAGAIYLFTIRR